jgi:Spy/CpxP family protein refolding chaperone
MKKLLVVLGLTGIMVLGAALTFANPPGSGFGPRSGYGPGYGRTNCAGPWEGGNLNLMPEQKTKLQDLHRRFRAENAQLFGSLVAKRMELQALWADSSADPKAIIGKDKELRGLQDQMRDKRVQMQLEARKFLVSEQIGQFGRQCGMGPGGMRAQGSCMGEGRRSRTMQGFGAGPGVTCPGECYR